MAEHAAPTVVIISHNQADQLPKVMSALAGGSLTPAEVILADDASTDDTVAVFERLLSRLHLPGRALRHKPGATAFRVNSMRNAGLQAARTDCAVILDADHVVGPAHLAAHAEMLQRGPNVISTGPRMEFAFTNGAGPVGYMWGHEPYGNIQADAEKPLPFWGLTAASNMGLHTAFAERVGWFDSDYDGSYGYDDMDFTFRASKLGAFFAGRFEAYVIHIPHETIFGNRDGSRNAELFRRKHGMDITYPPFVGVVTHPDTWAKRYARNIAAAPPLGQALGQARQSTPTPTSHQPDSLGPPPPAGAPCIETTRWAATNVGGRFLLKLAMEKLFGKFKTGKDDAPSV